jgi:hypothetical protein
MTRVLSSSVRRSGVYTLALALTLVAGGVGAAYPAALLAEPRAPGLVAGLLLGLAGAAFAAPLWAVPLAVAATAGGDPAGPRVTLYTAGRTQLSVRAAEAVAVARLTAELLAAGSVGGALSAAAQQRHGIEDALSQAPAPATFASAVAIAGGAAALGWALGIAAGRVVPALAVYAGGASLTAVLAGIAYFASNFRFAVALSPFGALLGLVRDELFSRQFTVETPVGLRIVGVCLWSLALAWTLSRRLSRAVR